MNQEPAPSPAMRWHVASWPPLAWLETGIKPVAIVAGIVALIWALSEGSLALPGGLRLVQVAILALLSLGLGAAIFDRIVEREIVAMVFVLLSNVGH